MIWKRIAAVAALLALGLAADARADEPTFTVPANANDPGISTARGENLIWLADEDRRVGKLLVFLPTGGATNLPTEFKHLGTEMGRLGYHTIILAYRNEAPIAALPTAPVPGCGTDEDPSLASPTCAKDARTEILSGSVPGGGPSTVVNVDRANSIENRLNKALVHLAATRPEAEGWAQFIDNSGSEPQPKWSETVIAGSSLGAGQAALIAAKYSVYRAALMHGWVDAKHGWVTLDQTPSSKYFTLIHQRDNFFGRTCYAYRALGLTTSCPLDGLPIVATGNCLADSPALPANPLWFENLQPPYGNPLHVFNLKPGSFAGTGDYCHQSTSRDGWIAKEADGLTPSQILVNAWRSVLGDRDADGWLEQDAENSLEHADNCASLTNPGQDDADADGIGDACDATPRGTTPPVISVTPVTVDATGPAGALVGYTATATDDLDGERPVTCLPAPGQFVIGTTTVACSASDAGANPANASFPVKVRSAPEQLARLVTKVGGSPQLAALVGSVDPNRPLQRFAACLTLRAFVTLVPWVVSGPQAAEWIGDANRIRAVLAC